VTGCLDEATVLGFLAGALPTATRGEVEAHVAACSGCAEILTWAAADSANRSRAPGREGAPFIGQLAPGARVDRYQILGPVGRGGMGEVYAAYHPDLDRRIALKIVFESGADAAERRARLLREARAIARLSHPNVVTVFDAGTVGDRVYIAMEFVDGETLDAWLAAKPRGWAEILDVFVAAGHGLSAAHAAKIIHRDFKPQNVMIAKDGVVRVMDFGLAQLVREEEAPESESTEAVTEEPSSAAALPKRSSPPTDTRATKTGALLGTPAYMAPEQFRGDVVDARADQFSFSVALHEALLGERPTLKHLQVASATTTPNQNRVDPVSQKRNAPRWLLEIVSRGLAPDRDARFSSMAELLATVDRARARPRRRVSGLVAALVIVVGTVGGWRLSHARRFDCAPPVDRISAAWPVTDSQTTRRASIRAALVSDDAASGETTWQRLSSILDQYLRQWSATYKDACEATHARGEQSAEVLDLRMRCLNDNLDEVRALTDVLVSGGGGLSSKALGAASSLTPVARCSDVRLLRSAVPLPRDEQSLRRVQDLRRSLKDVNALYELGRFSESLKAATALRREVEATGYSPLLAELLNIVAWTEVEVGSPAEAKVTLGDAIGAAEAGGDDIELAKGAATMSFVVGYVEGRAEEGLRWARLANAALDRAGTSQPRIRGWALQSEAAILARQHDFESALPLFRRSVELKTEVLGPDHPDVAVSLGDVGYALAQLHRWAEALHAADRALKIVKTHGGRAADALNCRGESLFGLGRLPEARETFDEALRIEQSERSLAYPLTGLGRVRIAQGEPGAAIAPLERALRIRDAQENDPTFVAETRFALAKALWDSGGDRARAVSLARTAKDKYAAEQASSELGEVDAWLASHPTQRKRR
jgi:serine/threonine protein kinase/tetratricopeptide (TPR) repeat protein